MKIEQFIGCLSMVLWQCSDTALGDKSPQDQNKLQNENAQQTNNPTPGTICLADEDQEITVTVDGFLADPSSVSLGDNEEELKLISVHPIEPNNSSGTADFVFRHTKDNEGVVEVVFSATDNHVIYELEFRKDKQCGISGAIVRSTPIVMQQCEGS